MIIPCRGEGKIVTIYNFNLALGWASSGVEYAQAYREGIFKTLKLDTKFVFAELILNGNIFDMADQIGMSINNILPVHFFFTNLKPSKSVYSIENFEKNIDLEQFQKLVSPNTITYQKDHTMIRIGLDKIHNNVDFVDYVHNGYLLRKDHYTYTKTFSEYYVPVDNKAEVYRRVFYHESGQVAYEQLIDQDKVTYRIGAVILYSEFEFIDYFVKQLQLTDQDVLIIDRELYIAPAVLSHKNHAKVGVVIHAEHYSSNQTDDKHIVWNNFYEYQFTNAGAVDFFVTATRKQKEVLTEQFKYYKGIEPTVYAIPVGNLEKLYGKRQKRVQNHLMTASRLAGEKHVDSIVRAILKVHETVPSLKLDIYGTGGEMVALQTLIEDNNAGEFIKLKGHQNLTKVYMHYHGYISASQSEGFGLTLMEAVGSGLPIVGYNVPYGNQEFVDEGVNGFLAPFSKNSDKNVESLAESIKQLIISNEDNNFKKASYQKAEFYLLKNTKLLWQKLLEDVIHD